MKKKRLLIIYFIASIIWIYSTNIIFEKVLADPYIYYIERLKEIVYVIVTGSFFYFYIRKSEQLNESQEEEKRLSTLINSMVDFVNFKDGEGKWIEANEFGLKLFQIDHVDYRGKKDSELAEYTSFYADSLRYCEISDEEAWKNGKITRIEEVIPLPNGTVKTFDTIKVPLFHSDGSREGLVIMGRDITERKEVEKLLEESRQQYYSLFEYSPDIIFTFDLEGKFTNLNRQFETITGYKVDEMIGKNYLTILPEENHDRANRYLSAVMLEKKPQMFEAEIHHHNGETIILQCTLVPIIVNNQLTGSIGYGKDITSLRQAEERLRRTEKLSVVGELSASVAHEIRNPLTSLKGFVQLLKVDDEKHHFYYQIMLDELNRINHIVSELLLLAKPQEMQFSHVNLRKILQDVISLLNTEASLHDVQIDFTSEHTELWVDCEPNQLKQLFINIIKNAIEASSKDGIVFITMDKIEDEHVLIQIQDRGCGISKERLERIGEPFYSSKEKGTGLGLTVSYKIVQSHHGSITFKSEQNEGTIVQIKLPIQYNK